VTATPQDRFDGIIKLGDHRADAGLHHRLGIRSRKVEPALRPIQRAALPRKKPGLMARLQKVRHQSGMGS
jgi:hypothetical protein